MVRSEARVRRIVNETISSGKLEGLFEREFGRRPEIFRAPGRVNLIGEHTDYNDGFVLPSAIGFYAYVAIARRADRKLLIRSSALSEKFDGDARALPKTKTGKWFDYVLGVAVQLAQAGFELPGANVLVHGEVPIGAGLSSSAALEVAAAQALMSLGQSEMPLKEVAKICQRAENEFVGAHVGIMDQFISCFGLKDHALLLDCRSLEFEQVPIPHDVNLVICNTMVKHELSGGEYNLRRRQCEEGVRILSQTYSGIRALRDVTVEQLRAQAAAMPKVVYDRCRHVVEENARTLEAASRFRSRDLEAVGKLMRESHDSLRDLYQVSCAELDAMVESAEGLPGFIGGRMTGGGFGGCTVNLVEDVHAPSFAEKIAAHYRGKTGIVPEIYRCHASDGAFAAAKPQGLS